MSWQQFRCGTNCTAFPADCISERLYRETADALKATGLLAAGYDTVHLDDCIVAKARDSVTNELVADPERFPSGFKALGDYIHSLGAKFGFYTAMSSTTCGGYPASAHFEELDAKTFASWGVDYVKLDGCGDESYYPTGYRKFGDALQASGRDIVYSCSWPAYLGDDEAQKPFATFIEAGCNLWRNFIDMGPTVGYMQGVAEHWGNYSAALAPWAGPGHWHDPDMLTVGIDGISLDAMRTNMAIWCIVAAPLIMGNDVRLLQPEHLAILLNHDAIAVSQDPAGIMGQRLGGAAASNAPTQTWFRPLSTGAVAVGLYNAGPAPTHPWHSACDAFNASIDGYYSPKGPQPAGWCLNAFGESLLSWYCCNTPDCAGYNFSAASGVGCMMKDVDGPFVAAPGTNGATKPGGCQPPGGPASITVNFADVGLFPGSITEVFDIWAGSVVQLSNATSYTAVVPFEGTAFLRLRSTA